MSTTLRVGRAELLAAGLEWISLTEVNFTGGKENSSKPSGLNIIRRGSKIGGNLSTAPLPTILTRTKRKSAEENSDHTVAAEVKEETDGAQMQKKQKISVNTNAMNNHNCFMPLGENVGFGQQQASLECLEPFLTQPLGNFDSGTIRGVARPLISQNEQNRFAFYTSSEPTCSKDNADLVTNPNFRVHPPSQPGSMQFRHGTAPLPKFEWADPKDVWNLMCWKDNEYRRHPNYIQSHTTLEPRMRAILLDWLAEVCEVYKLHRETYHLAIDFIDRYLESEKNVPAKRLQLVGTSALFIAAKLEEIYPPKLCDFAYVTDGACKEDEILKQELIILKSLNWSLSPVTANNWITLYLQVAQRHFCGSQPTGATNSTAENRNPKSDFMYPQFSRLCYLRLCQLVDLCLMDLSSLNFPYSILAAAAVYHLMDPQSIACLVSGYHWEDISPCVTWMVPYAMAVKELGSPQLSLKVQADIPQDDVFNIQTHSVDMKCLERAHNYQLEISKTSRSSPVFLQTPADIFPTPPNSDERPAPGLARTSVFYPIENR